MNHSRAKTDSPLEESTQRRREYRVYWTFRRPAKTIPAAMWLPLAFAVELRTQAGPWVLLGAGLLYAASRIGAEALAGRSPIFPGRRAVGHWLPIATIALCAVFTQRADLAVGVIFATSVASLSLVMGLLIYFSSMTAHPSTRRTWPFVLPATLLPLIAGFTGHLSWIHALMMLVLGGGIWSVWT